MELEHPDMIYAEFLWCRESKQTIGTFEGAVECEYCDKSIEVSGTIGAHFCVRCDASDEDTALRSIKMWSGECEMLCESCFEDALDADDVHPSDPRLRNEWEVRR